MQPDGPSGTWALTWHDEFDDSIGSSGPTNGLANRKWNTGWFFGPSAPGNTADQSTTTPPANPSANGNYHSPGAVTLPGDGSVHLSGTAGSFTFSGTTYTYNAGGLSTAGLMAINPASVALGATLQAAVNAGTVAVIDGTCVLEVRIRLPGPNSLSGSHNWWPVIWHTTGGNFNGGADWPGGENYLSEVDDAEWYDGGGMTGAHGKYNLHQASSSPINGDSSVAASLASTDLSLAFHTYTFEFTPTTITAWTDGTMAANFPDSSGAVASQWAPGPQFLMVFLQSQKTNPPNTSAGNDMMIDYVRVFTPA